MITGKMKSDVDSIWETFWTGGITNPLTVIEQFTYLLFIRQIDEVQKEKELNAEFTGNKVEDIFYLVDEKTKEKVYDSNLRWSNFKNLPAEEMFSLMQNKVFRFIKELGKETTSYTKYMEDALFLIPTPLMLTKIIDMIDEIDLTDKDSNGDLYEYLLSKLSTAGTNGQFRTPRHIIKMIVELMKPTSNDIIVDPAMGSAGFLVASAEYVTKNDKNLFLNESLVEHFNKNMFYGTDMDRTMLRIGAMNMVLHGVEQPNIYYQDSLSTNNTDEEKYTLVLANPPFKGSLDKEIVSKSLTSITDTKKTELLFLALILRILKKGGRCAVIVPDGVLFGSSKAHIDIRKEIVENHELRGVISMPSGVFKPYAGVSTAILIFNKTDIGGTDKVWFYDMISDGYSLDDKRLEISENDIPDIITRFNNLENEKYRTKKEQSFFVDKDEIVENDYDLSMSKYQDVEYDEVYYEAPNVIMEKIQTLESEIIEAFDELKGLI